MIKKILTNDQSETFFNEEVNETYHSHTGAIQEAILKYVEPCKIREIAKSGNLKILDVCFGLGYNSAMAIEIALQENPNCKIEVIGLEYDPNIVKKIQEVNPQIKFYQYYKRLNKRTREFKEGNVKVKLLLGDARETVKELNESHFDAIFFDPFSPKKHPHLWEKTLFQEMYRVMNSSAILATYSCARVVRDNMSAAGLFYDDGPIVGRRGPGTIATKWI